MRNMYHTSNILTNLGNKGFLLTAKTGTSGKSAGTVISAITCDIAGSKPRSSSSLSTSSSCDPSSSPLLLDDLAYRRTYTQ